MSNKSDYGVQRNVLKVIIRDEEFGLNEAQIRKVPGNRFLHLLLTHERVKATKKMWVDRRPEVFPFIQEYLSGREPFPITEEMAIYHGMFRGQLLKYLVEDAEFYNLTELALKAKIELLKIELEQATKVNVPAIIDKTLVDLQIKRMAHKIELKQIEIDFALKKEEFKIAAEKLNLEGQKAVQKAQAEIHRSANLIKVLDKQKEGVIVLPLSPNSNVYFCTNNQASHQDEHVAPTAEPETLPIPQETPTAEIERRILSALTLPTAADPGTHLKPAPETTLLAGGLQPINPDEVFTPPVTTSGKHQKLKPTKKKLPRAPLKGSVVPSNDIAGPTSGPDANLPGREGQVKKVSEEKHVTIVPKESTKGKKATKAISIAQAKDVADNHKVGAAPQPVKHNALKSQIQPFNNFGTVDESILPVKPVPGGEDTNSKEIRLNAVQGILVLTDRNAIAEQTQTSVPKPTSVDGENLLRSPSVSPPRLTWAEKGKGRARDRSSGSKESESINKQMEAFFNRPIDLGEGTSTQGVKATLPVDGQSSDPHHRQSKYNS